MASDTHLMERVVLYGTIGLVILFVILLLILALARPIQAAPHRSYINQQSAVAARMNHSGSFGVASTLKGNSGAEFRV